ncbi:MAG: GIY-YIG nuclease family protein [Proteobacteria bacterium]|nr:GIY-YIG nuclease family protein [Pseudomonadota bacterium]
MKKMYVYIMSNKPNGTIYIGVTNDLIRRVYEHKNKLIKGFTSQYDLNRLVYYEIYENEIAAIQREKNLKHYIRKWKIDIINKFNPEWKDLYQEIIK